MSDTQIAIAISFFSLALAIVSLGWNVYRDVFLKPRLKVSSSLVRLVSENGLNGNYTALNVINLGPGHITLHAIRFENMNLIDNLLRRWRYNGGFITHDYRNPHSAKLPIRIESGDSISYYFPLDELDPIWKNMSKIGVSDSFNRFHWATKRSLRELQKNL